MRNDESVLKSLCHPLGVFGSPAAFILSVMHRSDQGSIATRKWENGARQHATCLADMMPSMKSTDGQQLLGTSVSGKNQAPS